MYTQNQINIYYTMLEMFILQRIHNIGYKSKVPYNIENSIQPVKKVVHLLHRPGNKEHSHTAPGPWEIGLSMQGFPLYC